jgi:ketosteroid isomerase-like protein
MSQENVETVKRIYAEFERGNFWLPDLFDPSIELVWSDAMFARSAQSKGHEELTAHMRELFDAWERVTATAERIIDAGDQVLVVAVWRGRGKSSGADVARRQGLLWTIRSGKAVRVVTYDEPAGAFEAAGLSE